MCVPSGWSLTLYSKSNFQGDEITFGPGTYDDLKDQNWDNKASSIKVEGLFANQPPQECNDVVMLFEHDYFRGLRVRLDDDNPKLGIKPFKFNNKADSLCVPPNWTLWFYRGNNYKGSPSVKISAGSTVFVYGDLKNDGPGSLDDWHDRISSVKITKP